MMELSILICCLEKRKPAKVVYDLFHKIMTNELYYDVEILLNCDDGTKSIGKKRNELIQRAQGDYLCFVDDDDEVSCDYLVKILQAIQSNPDCCSLTGQITWDGERPETFIHSLRYSQWHTNPDDHPIKYERTINHLNVIRSSIAKQFQFPNVSHGEDHEWARAISESGLLKTESYIEGIIYLYKFKPDKR